MNSQLKPCPFCGGPVELERATDTYEYIHGRREWWGAVCRNTMNRGGSCAIQQRPSASKEAAIDRWNMRTPAAPVKEPVDCCANCLRPEHEHQDGRCPKPFTTVWHAWDYDFPPKTPPAAQRQWVPLTDKKIGELYRRGWANNTDFARAIEAEVRKENGGAA